jgi:hypothetical protein
MISEIATLTQIETELKKRWQFPYHWGRFQNDKEDKLTNFIYEILYFEDLLDEIKRRLKKEDNYDALFQYTLNRWYNFWSAKGIEHIFALSPKVKANPDSKDKFKDFDIQSIPFDHKSSIFPKSYPSPIEFAIQNPVSLIEWLYQNQSQEQRKHLKNRLFIVFFDTNHHHWKLKAEISWLRTKIEEYLDNFQFERLQRISFSEQEIVFSDIIWAIKESQ